MSMDGKYDDIIGLEHPSPRNHPRMSPMDRAAQFAPFAALTGYEEVIEEKGRRTMAKVELDETQMDELNGTMAEIAECLSEKPSVSITFFRKDPRKAGGEYLTVSGRVRNIDVSTREVVLADGMSVPVGDILEIKLVR